MTDAEKLHAIAAWLDDVEEYGAERRDLRRLRRILNGTMTPAEVVAARLAKAFEDSGEDAKVFLGPPRQSMKQFGESMTTYPVTQADRDEACRLIDTAISEAGEQIPAGVSEGVDALIAAGWRPVLPRQ